MEITTIGRLFAVRRANTLGILLCLFSPKTRSSTMKSCYYFIALTTLFLASGTVFGQTPSPKAATANLSKIDPGSYDGTWWNRTPVRLIQTNLRETDALMNTDAYVQSMVDASANVVMLNVGGIVANYPTRLDYHFKNQFMKDGDLVGDLVKKAACKGYQSDWSFRFQ
jgi:hypothetical protein